MRVAAPDCVWRQDAQDFAWEVGGPYREVHTMLTTMYRTIALAIAALWSLPVSAGDLPPASVYVAPGGVYIGSAQVYVGPRAGNGGQPHAPPGAAPGPGYGAPALAPRVARTPSPCQPGYA